MKATKVYYLLLFILLTFTFAKAYAQEEHTTTYQAKRYIDLNLKSLDKYNARVAKQQQRLLARLRRKEAHYANSLKRKDSAGYAKFQQQPLTYDSISKLSKPDSATVAKKSNRRPDASIDSLKAIKSFVENKIHLQGKDKDNQLNGYDVKLAQTQGQGNYNNYINDLIGQRTNNLKNINAGSKGKVSGFKGIEKNVFYSREKIKVFKQMKDDPSKAEDKALEYLQGEKGFENAQQNADGSNRLALAGKSTGELEKMGMQTKRQMTEQLQKKFGTNNLSGLQQSMGKQVSQFQDKTKEFTSAKNNLKQTKQSLKKLKNTDRPSFKINPMRGLPFSKRVEKGYDWQTTRATIDGKPAMLQFGATVGFKQTAKLTYGLGLAASLGLGQNWNNIHFSFHGLTLRSYAMWELLYGINAYAGYERTYKHEAFTAKKEIPVKSEINSHNHSVYSEAVLIGLTKSYKVNEKWNGSLQVLYDIWWKEKGMRSPVLIRFATTKN